jgi:hypothetical protein
MDSTRGLLECTTKDNEALKRNFRQILKEVMFEVRKGRATANCIPTPIDLMKARNEGHFGVQYGIFKLQTRRFTGDKERLAT